MALRLQFSDVLAMKFVVMLFIFLICIMDRNQVLANTCVTFPNDTSSCNLLSLTCSNFGMDDGDQIKYESFEMTSDATARNHMSHSYATCRIKEVCTGSTKTDNQPTRCNVIEDVLTELEPSLCPGMCYYIIVPHHPCGDGNYTATVYMTHVPEGNTVIKVYRAQSTLPAANVTISPGCNGIEEGQGADPATCEILVDQSCPGTNVQTFEAGQDIELNIKSVTGKKAVAVTFSNLFETPVTALVTIHDTHAGDTNTGDGSQTTENAVAGVDDGTKTVKTKLVIDSVVLDITLVNDRGEKIQLDKDHLIYLSFGSDQPGGFKQRVCRYFDEDEEKWSGYGCHVSSSNDTTVTCACNHTTSFAVLLQFEDCTVRGANLNIQTLMTRFFNAISIAALFLSVIIFCYLKLYASDQVKVHICLAISLALAQLVMLFMDQTHHKGMCRAIAGIMHYLLTAYCISMILEGTLLHRKASRTHKAPVKGWVIVLAVWGIPCVMVAVLMGSQIDGYGGECACFLNVEYKYMYIWLAEVCLVVGVNTVLLYLIMRTFVSLKANAKKSDADRLKATARAVLIMVPMLGMTWVFGVLQAVFKDVFLQWFFILLNALQGPLFFVFQCVMHPEVQKVIGRKRKVGDSSKWAMNTSTSGTGRTQSTDKGTSQFTESKLSKGI